MTLAPAFRAVQQKFTFVPEREDFLTLFPHRDGYLWAEHPQHDTRPVWHTETKHPLSDRLINQGSYLYGVRFGKVTHYLMLDIDVGSRFHPYKDPYAVGRICNALEPLGLVSHVAVSSSYSGGIHLYFPVAHGQTTWRIAHAAAALLENKGFKLEQGQLEQFPNPRRSNTADYNGHRLPLQLGSYLLDADFQPINTSHPRFVEAWTHAENRNALTEETVTHVLKTSERKAYRKLGISAQKFLNDLNAEIEPGWTGYGQTNAIVGRLALRTYVFGHILHGGSPMQGEILASWIFEFATALPGYSEYCRHQPEMVDLCLDWARSVEKSDYYPYGGDQVSTSSNPNSMPSVTWNQKQAQSARDRISQAIDDLTAKGEYPNSIRSRLFAIKAYGISSSTLYKNKDLWYVHKPLEPAPSKEIQPVQVEWSQPRTPEPAPRAAIHPEPTISLYSDPCPAPKGGGTEESSERAVGGSGGFSTGSPPPPLEGADLVLEALRQIRQRQRQNLPPPSNPSDSPPPDENWWFQQRGGTS
jgi:hypothetical protein